MKITKIEKIPYVGNVYNLKVRKYHNFFIGNGLLVSNCHGAKAMSIKKISEKCINAEFRLGFTGSMPKEDCDCKTIQSALGPTLIKIKSEELIDRNILSQITIANILLKYPIETIENYKTLKIEYNREKRKFKDEINPNFNIKKLYDDELQLLINHPLRNRIFNYIFNKIPDGQNSLILVDLIEHLENIKEYLEKNLDKKYKIKIYYGGIKASEREKIRQSMENEGNTIILATYKTFSTGINVKKLHNVFLGSPRKSFISLIQTIGRGLRKHKTKDKLIFFDIVDDLTYSRELTKGPRKGKLILEKNYFYGQFEERLKIYKEQKFEYFTKRVDLKKV